MKTLALLVLLILLVALTACGGSSSTMPPPPPPPPVANASVAVSSNTGAVFDVAMSTSFQPAEWDYQFFTNFPGAINPLTNLQPNHIRLQGISKGVPQGSEGTSSPGMGFRNSGLHHAAGSGFGRAQPGVSNCEGSGVHERE